MSGPKPTAPASATAFGEGGSDYIRSKVFRACLETERKMWAENAPASTALTAANYVFEDAGVQSDGLTSFFVKPRRKDALLVDGSIYLDPDDGDLVRVEGRLIKAPSFWTRRVDVVRWYRRFAGIRMPVVLESVADVRIAGESTFRVTYDYEFVNSQRVGSPQPLLAYASVAVLTFQPPERLTPCETGLLARILPHLQVNAPLSRSRSRSPPENQLCASGGRRRTVAPSFN
jgi:hypothetical protein